MLNGITKKIPLKIFRCKDWTEFVKKQRTNFGKTHCSRPLKKNVHDSLAPWSKTATYKEMMGGSGLLHTVVSCLVFITSSVYSPCVYLQFFLFITPAPWSASCIVLSYTHNNTYNTYAVHWISFTSCRCKAIFQWSQTYTGMFQTRMLNITDC